MKTVMLLFLTLCVLTTNAKHQRMTLQKAIESKLVKAKASSLGGYQGYCVNMKLQNLTKDSLQIFVEAGRRLNSADDRFQDILIIKEEFITLRKAEEKSFKVKGYCCQASNCAPSSNAVYEVNKMADSNLVKIARFLNANQFSPDIEQHAIWSISDKRPTANITSKNDSSLMPLRQLICGIKGEQMPWYNTVTGTYMYSNGVISSYPIALKGKMQVSNDAGDYVTLYIFNEKGRQVCMVKSQWLNQGQNMDYDLNIPLKGLERGKYTIALKTSSRELAKKEFEI